jgi:hypothetical protein
MPCRTCSLTNFSSCLTCYSNTQISLSIYYDSILKYCYQQCIAGKYAVTVNSTTNLCMICDTNCLTCIGNATFCLSCDANTIYKYLYINTTIYSQKCYSQCPATYYPDTTITPTTCKLCFSPCK